jgi:hypothetical protein
MLDLSCPHFGTDLLAWDETRGTQTLLDGEPVRLSCTTEVCRVGRVEVTLDV